MNLCAEPCTVDGDCTDVPDVLDYSCTGTDDDGDTYCELVVPDAPACNDGGTCPEGWVCNDGTGVCECDGDDDCSILGSVCIDGACGCDSSDDCSTEGFDCRTMSM